MHSAGYLGTTAECCDQRWMIFVTNYAKANVAYVFVVAVMVHFLAQRRRELKVSAS